MTTDLLTLLEVMITGALGGLVWTCILYFRSDANTATIDWAALAANGIMGLCIGGFAGYMGIPITPEYIGGEIGAYAAIIAVLDSFFQGILNRTVRAPKFVFIKNGKPLKNPLPPTDRVKFFAGVIAAIRKMDPESRDYLVFDLPTWAQQPTLNCVDKAEAATPPWFQYAIQAANWVFLIEDGELTGACHYWSIFGWFGQNNVVCKPISDATLTAIRRTGKFPAYNDLT
jgi:hypothetical protein